MCEVVLEDDAVLEDDVWGPAEEPCTDVEEKPGCLNATVHMVKSLEMRDVP